MSAMASGDVDVGYVGITPVIYSISKEVPVRIVAGAQMKAAVCFPIIHQLNQFLI